MSDSWGRGLPARGRNTLDLLESRQITLHSPEGFRNKLAETELCRFVAAGVPAGALPLEIEFEVYVPSSRVFQLYSVAFDEDSGQPPQVLTGAGAYTYNATWGPVNAETRFSSGIYQPINEVIPALTPLPDSREVNTGVKRMRGAIVITGAPTVAGVPVTGCWRLTTMGEPNQHFTGADEEWSRIADEILVKRGNIAPTGEGGGGALGPGRGNGPAIVLVQAEI